MVLIAAHAACSAVAIELVLPLVTKLKELLRSTIDAGYGDDDFMALFLHLRDHSTQAVLP